MKNKKSLFIIGSILIVVLVVIILCGLNNEELAQDSTPDKQQDEITTQTEELGQEIELDDSLVVTSFGSYSGPYLEDGSDELVEDILMITVKNNGTQTLQYAEIQLSFDTVAAEFSLSTLKPGESMVVLEKNRLGCPDSDEITGSQIDNVVYFNEALNFCEDKFEISALDGAFNIKNISGKDLTGNIAIYYKNKQEDIYYGGITYRVVIEGGIEKDGIKQVITNHFNLDNSEVMFVSYTELE